MALITTPGAADANSYASLAEADDYYAGHLYASGWINAASGTKVAALIMATRLLDAMPGAWTGAAASAAQALGWPRLGMFSRNGFAIEDTAIPVDLKNAEAEYAGQLIGSNLTETNAILAQGITSVKAGPVSVSFKDQLSQHDAAIPANRALAAMVPDAVKMLLVPSWLVDPRTEDVQFSGLILEEL